MWVGFLSCLPNLLCRIIKQKILTDFVGHWVDESRHHHVIFCLPNPVTWLLFSRFGCGAGLVVIFSLALDNHQHWLWPLKVVLTIELVPRNCEHVVIISDYSIGIWTRDDLGGLACFGGLAAYASHLDRRFWCLRVKERNWWLVLWSLRVLQCWERDSSLMVVGCDNRRKWLPALIPWRNWF